MNAGRQINEQKALLQTILAEHRSGGLTVQTITGIETLLGRPSLKALAINHGVNEGTLSSRLARGWTLEQALVKATPRKYK